jgi:hypothetical protein
VCLGTSAGQDLIPPTGADGLDWIADVDDASDLFFVGAWLIILTMLVGLGVADLVMVTISHLIPIAGDEPRPPESLA